MCIFLYLALPAPTRQCRNQRDKYVISRRGAMHTNLSVGDQPCAYYVDVGTHLLGPFASDQAAEAALRVAAQVEVAS